MVGPVEVRAVRSLIDCAARHYPLVVLDVPRSDSTMLEALELVTTIVDVMPYAERKRKALEAHASQGDNIFFLRMPDEILRQVFGAEAFTRTRSDVAVPDLEDDLFAGLR